MTYPSDLPTTAMGALRLLASTQSQIDNFSDQLIQDVKSGEVNPLELILQLKAMEKVTERVKKEIHENVMTAADKYPGTVFEFMGNKVEKAELGTKYLYETCNDLTYNRLSKELKERTEFLKAVKAPTTIVDESTGETWTILPPKKQSSTGLKITIL